MSLSNAPKSNGEMIDETVSVAEAIALLNMSDDEAAQKLPRMMNHQGLVNVQTGRSGLRQSYRVSPANLQPEQDGYWSYRVYSDNNEVQNEAV